MAEIDKVKEEIGWLKAVFALLIATDVSLLGWAAQNFFKLPTFLLVISVILLLCITFAIIFINRKAYKKIDELGGM